MLWNDEGPHLKGAEDIDVHVYGGDGLRVECRPKHDIPDHIRQQGVRLVGSFNLYCCPGFGVGGNCSPRTMVRSSQVSPPRGSVIPY